MLRSIQTYGDSGASWRRSDVFIARRVGILDRLRAWFCARGLDMALADGVAPEATSALALRTRRLIGARKRRTLARSYRRIVREALEGVPRSRFRVAPCTSRVIAASEELIHLADALAEPGPVAARGVARARLLLTDGAGPLYDPASRADLYDRVVRAIDDLTISAAQLN